VVGECPEKELKLVVEHMRCGFGGWSAKKSGCSLAIFLARRSARSGILLAWISAKVRSTPSGGPKAKANPRDEPAYMFCVMILTGVSSHLHGSDSEENMTNAKKITPNTIIVFFIRFVFTVFPPF
jgi:hypothetical protein